MKQLVTFVLLFLFVPFATSQTWTYKSTGNDFDGKIRTARIDGKGGEFPYNTPSLIVNYFESDKSLNFYITDMGYTGCENNLAIFVIDGTSKFRTVDVSDDAEKSTLFFHEFEVVDSDVSNSVSILEMLKYIKAGSRLSIRVSNECYQRDYAFSLSGSTTAINFVLGKDFDEQMKQEERLKAALEEQLQQEIKQKEEFTVAKNVLSNKIEIADPLLRLSIQTKDEVIQIVRNELGIFSTPINDVQLIKIVRSSSNPDNWEIEIVVWSDETKSKTHSKKIAFPLLHKLGYELIIL